MTPILKKKENMINYNKNLNSNTTFNFMKAISLKIQQYEKDTTNKWNGVVTVRNCLRKRNGSWIIKNKNKLSTRKKYHAACKYCGSLCTNWLNKMLCLATLQTYKSLLSLNASGFFSTTFSFSSKDLNKQSEPMSLHSKRLYVKNDSPSRFEEHNYKGKPQIYSTGSINKYNAPEYSKINNTYTNKYDINLNKSVIICTTVSTKGLSRISNSDKNPCTFNDLRETNDREILKYYDLHIGNEPYMINTQFNLIIRNNCEPEKSDSWHSLKTFKWNCFRDSNNKLVTRDYNTIDFDETTNVLTRFPQRRLSLSLRNNPFSHQTAKEMSELLSNDRSTDNNKNNNETSNTSVRITNENNERNQKPCSNNRQLEIIDYLSNTVSDKKGQLIINEPKYRSISIANISSIKPTNSPDETQASAKINCALNENNSYATKKGQSELNIYKHLSVKTKKMITDEIYWKMYIAQIKRLSAYNNIRVPIMINQNLHYLKINKLFMQDSASRSYSTSSKINLLNSVCIVYSNSLRTITNKNTKENLVEDNDEIMKYFKQSDQVCDLQTSYQPTKSEPNVTEINNGKKLRKKSQKLNTELVVSQLMKFYKNFETTRKKNETTKNDRLQNNQLSVDNTESEAKTKKDSSFLNSYTNLISQRPASTSFRKQSLKKESSERFHSQSLHNETMSENKNNEKNKFERGFNNSLNTSDNYKTTFRHEPEQPSDTFTDETSKSSRKSKVAVEVNCTDEEMPEKELISPFNSAPVKGQQNNRHDWQPSEFEQNNWQPSGFVQNLQKADYDRINLKTPINDALTTVGLESCNENVSFIGNMTSQLALSKSVPDYSSDNTSSKFDIITNFGKGLRKTRAFESDLQSSKGKTDSFTNFQKYKRAKREPNKAFDNKRINKRIKETLKSEPLLVQPTTPNLQMKHYDHSNKLRNNRSRAKNKFYENSLSKNESKISAINSSGSSTVTNEKQTQVCKVLGNENNVSQLLTPHLKSKSSSSSITIKATKSNRSTPQKPRLPDMTSNQALNKTTSNEVYKQKRNVNKVFSQLGTHIKRILYDEQSSVSIQETPNKENKFQEIGNTNKKSNPSDKHVQVDVHRKFKKKEDVYFKEPINRNKNKIFNDLKLFGNTEKKYDWAKWSVPSTSNEQETDYLANSWLNSNELPIPGIVNNNDPSANLNIHRDTWQANSPTVTQVHKQYQITKRNTKAENLVQNKETAKPDHDSNLIYSDKIFRHLDKPLTNTKRLKDYEETSYAQKRKQSGDSISFVNSEYNVKKPRFKHWSKMGVPKEDENEILSTINKKLGIKPNRIKATTNKVPIRTMPNPDNIRESKKEKDFTIGGAFTNFLKKFEPSVAKKNDYIKEKNRYSRYRNTLYRTKTKLNKLQSIQSQTTDKKSSKMNKNVKLNKPTKIPFKKSIYVIKDNKFVNKNTTESFGVREITNRGSRTNNKRFKPSNDIYVNPFRQINSLPDISENVFNSKHHLYNIPTANNADDTKTQQIPKNIENLYQSTKRITYKQLQKKRVNKGPQKPKRPLKKNLINMVSLDRMNKEDDTRQEHEIRSGIYKSFKAFSNDSESSLFKLENNDALIDNKISYGGLSLRSIISDCMKAIYYNRKLGQ